LLETQQLCYIGTSLVIVALSCLDLFVSSRHAAREVTITLGKSAAKSLRHAICIAITTAVIFGGLVVSNQANAQSSQNYHSYGAGTTLISVPFDYTDDPVTEGGNPCLVFGLTTTSPAKSDFNFLAWLVGSFYEYPNLPANTLVPGSGYFLYSPNISRSVSASDEIVAAETNKLDPYAINLYAGWNLIGAPYHGVDTAYSVSLYGDAVGVITNDTRYTMRDAVSLGIIKAGLWSYYGGRYELSYSVDEWKGYWIKAYQSCQLVISRTETTRSRAAGVEAVSTSAKTDGWDQQIVASIGSSCVDSIQIGVSGDATDGFDSLKDIEKPPAVTSGPYVYASIPHTDWGTNSGNYGVDYHGKAIRTAWEFSVTSNVKSKDILLTWPGIGNLPKDTNLVLIDLETGSSRSLRTSSSYRFRMASGSIARRFKLQAAPAGRGILRINGLSIGGGRSVSRTITCNLSGSANVDVVIKTASDGNVVRSIAQGTSRAAGLNQFVWDCRTDSGKPAPSGAYICEVRATGDDGQVVKAMAVSMVAR
jgi:hypothetical protein